MDFSEYFANSWKSISQIYFTVECSPTQLPDPFCPIRLLVELVFGKSFGNARITHNQEFWEEGNRNEVEWQDPGQGTERLYLYWEGV